MDDKICGDLGAVEMECLLEGEKPKFRLYVSEFFSTHRRPSIGSCSDLPFRKSEDGKLHYLEVAVDECGTMRSAEDKALVDIDLTSGI